MEEAVLITTPASDKGVLEGIARTLLSRRLAACFQILGPIRSMYWWKGSLEETDEWLGVIKTRAGLYDEVEKVIRAGHPYEVPQIVCMRPERLGLDYHAWIVGETTGPGCPGGQGR